jgi:hypothetical protein
LEGAKWFPSLPCEKLSFLLKQQGSVYRLKGMFPTKEYVEGLILFFARSIFLGLNRFI